MIETKLLFKELEEDITKQLDFYENIGEEARKMVKRTLSLHRMMKHMYKRNNWLQADRKNFQGQVKVLETHIEMIKVELAKRNLKIIA